METFFNFLPEELLSIILHNITDYNDFVNLYKLNKVTNFQNILNSKVFWKNLFNSFGDLINSVNINFDNTNIYYMAAMYERATNSYVHILSEIDSTIEYINEGIKEYYPKMSMGNIDIDKIEEDGNYDNLFEKGIEIVVDGRYVTDFSLFFGNSQAIETEEIELGRHLGRNNEIINLELRIDFLGYLVNVRYRHITRMRPIAANLHVPDIPKNEFIKIMFHVAFNGHIFN